MQSTLHQTPLGDSISNHAQPLKRICKSYKDAYLTTMKHFHRRYYKSLGLFSVIFAILFQLRFSLNYHTLIYLFTWRTALFSILLFLTGLSLSFIRAVAYTIWEPTYPSYLAELIATWLSVDNFFLLCVHSIFSLAIVRFYFSVIAGEAYTLEFLMQPPGHYLGARQLNQENIFIAVYSIILAFNYTFHFLTKRSAIVKINNVQQPFANDLKTSFATILCSSAIRAIYSFRNTYLIFIFCNGTIYHYVARFFGITYFYRVLDSPIVGFRWTDIHLFLRLIIAGMVTMCTFNTANRLYDIIYSTTVPVTDDYGNQFDCLIDGLADQKDNAKIAAFSELALLTCKRPDKRAELFLTTGKDLKESAWYRIMTQCFHVINDLKTKIDIEYNGVQPVATPVPVTKPVSDQQVRNRLQLSKGDIYTVPKTEYSQFDDRTHTIFSSAAAKYLPADNVCTATPNCARKAWATLSRNQLVKLMKRIEFQVGRIGAFEQYYAETVARRVQTVFNKYQLVVWAVQSLGSLTAGSLKEDPYGYVQNDLHNVLNQLSTCLAIVEKYLKSPPQHYSKLLNENVVVQESEAVLMALREAIYQIKITFQDYLDTETIM